jgi:hypothetical protein
MNDLSDTQIRKNLRTLLLEAGIDPDQAALVCAGGIVRVLGELLAARADRPVKPAQVGELEQSIRRSKGVKQVYFNVRNWERVPTGEWQPTALAPEDEKADLADLLPERVEELA